MTWRSSLFDAAHVDVTVNPAWLLAPLFARDFLSLAVESRDTLPGPLSGSLPRETADIQELQHDRQRARKLRLAAAGTDWPLWWAAAMAYRPGTPAPRQADLVEFSPELSETWHRAEPWFDRWSASRTPTDAGPAVEHQLLGTFADRYGHAPAPRSLRVLVIPVAGDFLSRPQADRLVVASALRGDRRSYELLLEPIFAEFFSWPRPGR